MVLQGKAQRCQGPGLMVQKVISSGKGQPFMFTDPCSHSTSLLFQVKQRASSSPCTDFPWSSHL